MIEVAERAKLHEVWRVEYAKDAYVDQTGMSHWGYIVRERQVVQEVGRFAMDDGYGGHYPTAGIVATNPRTGEEFRYRPNLVDYIGGGAWKNQATGDFWIRPPGHPRGYVYPDGSAPVERVLDG